MSRGKNLTSAVAGVLTGLGLAFVVGRYGSGGTAAGLATASNRNSRSAAETGEPAAMTTPSHAWDPSRALGVGGGLAPALQPTLEEKSLDQLKADVLHDHEERVRKHWLESRDAVWSEQAERSVHTDFAAMTATGKTSFALKRVDCRSTTCVSVVDWPSYALAMKEFRDVLQYPYKTPCDKWVVVPDPREPNGPVEVSVLMNCESWRAHPEALTLE